MPDLLEITDYSPLPPGTIMEETTLDTVIQWYQEMFTIWYDQFSTFPPILRISYLAHLEATCSFGGKHRKSVNQQSFVGCIVGNR